MFSVSSSMLEINIATKQVTNVSLVLKDSDTESENLSSLIRLSVSYGQKAGSSKRVSRIQWVKRVPLHAYLHQPDQ